MMWILLAVLGGAVALLALAVFILAQMVFENAADLEEHRLACALQVMDGAEALHRAEKNIDNHTIESGQ